MSMRIPLPAVLTEFCGTVAFQYAVVDGSSSNDDTGCAVYVRQSVRPGLMYCGSLTECASTPNVESHVCQRGCSSVRPSGLMPGAGCASMGSTCPPPGCTDVSLSGYPELR